MSTVTNDTAPTATRQPGEGPTPAVTGEVVRGTDFYGKPTMFGTFTEQGTDNPIPFWYEQKGDRAEVTFDLCPSKHDNMGEGPITITVKVEDAPGDCTVTSMAVALQFEAMPEIKRTKFAVHEDSHFYERFSEAAVSIHDLFRNEYQADRAKADREAAEAEADDRHDLAMAREAGVA